MNVTQERRLEERKAKKFQVGINDVGFRKIYKICLEGREKIDWRNKNIKIGDWPSKIVRIGKENATKTRMMKP